METGFCVNSSHKLVSMSLLQSLPTSQQNPNHSPGHLTRPALAPMNQKIATPIPTTVACRLLLTLFLQTASNMHPGCVARTQESMLSVLPRLTHILLQHRSATG